MILSNPVGILINPVRILTNPAEILTLPYALLPFSTPFPTFYQALKSEIRFSFASLVNCTAVAILPIALIVFKLINCDLILYINKV